MSGNKLVVFILALLITSNAAALAADFWPPEGARAVALGGGIGSSNDAGAVFINPAGLAWQTERQVITGLNNYSLLGLNSIYFGCVLPLTENEGALGLGYSQLDAGTFAMVPFSEKNLNLALARKLGNFAVAINLETAQQVVDTDLGQARSLDLAGSWRWGSLQGSVVWDNAFSWQKWQQALSSPEPSSWQVSAAWQHALGTINVTGTFQEESWQYRYGFERDLGSLSLRAGWNGAQPVFGAGFKKGMLQVDYACRNTDSGWMNMVTTLLKF